MAAEYTERFIAWADDDAPKLADQIRRLDEEATDTLEAILHRFDCGKNGSLEHKECWLARRAIDLIHRPSRSPLDAMKRVLDYLDVDDNNTLTLEEMTLAIEILELFANADSENGTLSTRELEMLEAVLKHLDTNNNGKLDEDERVSLRDGLWKPQEFLAEQKENNPHLRDVMGLD